jgi:hypothetical protein
MTVSVTSDAFRQWLDGAKLGDELVYHIGDLSADSDPAKGASARALDETIDAVLAAVWSGRASQRVVPLPAKGHFQYIAKRVA